MCPQCLMIGVDKEVRFSDLLTARRLVVWFDNVEKSWFNSRSWLIERSMEASDMLSFNRF
jgi:hypothetical protein